MFLKIEQKLHKTHLMVAHMMATQRTFTSDHLESWCINNQQLSLRDQFKQLAMVAIACYT